MGTDLSLIPMTLTIVIATAAVTIVAFRNEAVYRALMLDVDDVLHGGQFWRMLTSGLVHADWMHLFANMVSLFAFGSWMEHVIEPWRFLMLYVLGILIGSFTGVIKHRHDASYRAVGASGGVCAVVGGATVLYPDLPMIIFPLPIPISSWIVGVLFIVYSIAGMRGRWDNVGHDAHLGGTLVGMGLIAAFYPALALQHWPYIAAIAVAGGIAYIWMQRRPS